MINGMWKKGLVLGIIICLTNISPLVIGRNFSETWNIEGLSGIHSGNQIDDRITDWSDAYIGSETNSYRKAVLYLGQQGVETINLVLHVSGTTTWWDTEISNLLDAIEDLSVDLDVILDIEPNDSWTQQEVLDSIDTAIVVAKNGDEFYSSVSGISLDLEWLGSSASETASLQSYRERIVVDNSPLEFFPIWFSGYAKNNLNSLSNKNGVVPLYDGLVRRYEIIDGSKVYTKPEPGDSTYNTVMHNTNFMKNNGFSRSGVLPISFEVGSINEKQIIAYYTWKIYREAVIDAGDLDYCLFGNGIASENPFNIYKHRPVIFDNFYDDTGLNLVTSSNWFCSPINPSAYAISNIDDSEAFDEKTLELLFPGGSNLVGPGNGIGIESKKNVHYGRYVANWKAASCNSNEGVVSGFFTYWNEGKDFNGNGIHDNHEIDFEILGASPTLVYMTIWTDYQEGVGLSKVTRVVNLTNGDVWQTKTDDILQIPEAYPPLEYLGSVHSQTISNFDASATYYEYGFEWLPDSIKFYIWDQNGNEIELWNYENLQNIPFHPGKLLFNVWHTNNWKPEDKQPISAWLPPSNDAIAKVDWVKYSKMYDITRGLDLILLFDTTGSMYDDIAAAKSSATNIVNEIADGIPDFRIAVVDYRDFSVYPYGGSGDYEYHDVLGFSRDQNAIISAIQSLSLGWGADWRESVYSALMHCIDPTSLYGWRGEENAAKAIILIGDAPPHDPEPFTGYTLNDVVTAAENADPVHIYPIQIGGVVEKFPELAEQTGGSVFTASNAGEVVDTILEVIEEIKSNPIADANGPYEGCVNLPLTFDGTQSYDPDGSIVSYLWDLDSDGEFDDAYGASPTIILDETHSDTIYLKVTDDDGYTDIDEASIVIVDNTPPSIDIVVPSINEAVQDGVTFETIVADPSGVDWVNLSIRTPNGEQGAIIDEMYESIAAINTVNDVWQLSFDTTQLPDGYYLLLVEASDTLGNQGYETVNFSIRNWAVLELLPNTASNKAGRTMPVKFSLRICEAVDPDQPFVRNEELNVLIYEEGFPEDILQNSTYGDSSKDYRINSEDEQYITNFKTSKKLKTYVVEIWRNDMLIGSFNFETVK